MHSLFLCFRKLILLLVAKTLVTTKHIIPSSFIITSSNETAATETILSQESWIEDCQFLLKPTSSVSFEGSAIGMAASTCQS
jgi:hypothetical protein